MGPRYILMDTKEVKSKTQNFEVTKRTNTWQGPGKGEGNEESRKEWEKYAAQFLSADPSKQGPVGALPRSKKPKATVKGRDQHHPNDMLRHWMTE